ALCIFAVVSFFFFQAEDGIRDFHVTGVQTCALPISWINPGHSHPPRAAPAIPADNGSAAGFPGPDNAPQTLLQAAGFPAARLSLTGWPAQPYPARNWSPNPSPRSRWGVPSS